MKLKCRAKITSNCMDGLECIGIYGEDSMEDDGTFDGKTVVCDECYIVGGQPALPYAPGVTRSQVVEHVNREMGLSSG